MKRIVPPGTTRRALAPTVAGLLWLAGPTGCTHGPSPIPPAPAPAPAPQAAAVQQPPEPERPAAAFEGVASFYGHRFAGRLTASGSVFDPAAMTCAHRTLPFGTRLRVTNPRNGRTVVVTVTDRGPFVRGRLLDLSLGAARRLGMVRDGHARVRVEILRPGA